MAGRAVEGNAPWTKVEVVYPIVRDAIDFRMERRHFRVERGDGVGWRDARQVPIAQLSVKLDGLRVRQVRLGMPYGIIAAHWVPHSRAARRQKHQIGSSPPCVCSCRAQCTRCYQTEDERGLLVTTGTFSTKTCSSPEA